MKRTRCPHLVYSPAELAWLQVNCTLATRDYHQLFCERFSRADVKAYHLKQLRQRNGWSTGRSSRFVKGGPNPCGASHRAPPLGHERVDKRGYVLVSVPETRTDRPRQSRRFVPKHVHLWTQLNGPLPAGHCLKCLSTDHANSDPSNWEAMPRHLVPRLNGGPTSRGRPAYDQVAPEVRPLLLAAATLEHKVSELRRSRRA